MTQPPRLAPVQEPFIPRNCQPPGSFARLQWGFALAVAGFGCLFDLWLLVHSISGDFEKAELTKVEMVCIGGALICPVFLVALLALREAFLQWPNGRRMVVVGCLTLLALPAFLATSLVVFVSIFNSQ